MNETLLNILKWAGWAVFLGVLIWVQRKLFGPKNN